MLKVKLILPRKPYLDSRIETYQEKYKDDVIQIVRNFHGEAVGEYDNIFDVEALAQTIEDNAQNHHNCFLLILDGRAEGMLFGATFKSLINGKDIFQEIVWYVNEPYRRYGVKLLKDVQNILQSRGVNIMIMAVLENSKTSKLKSFYEKMGFKLMESHFVRSL